MLNDDTTDANEDDDQKGMEEAFASLEVLTTEDWNEGADSVSTEQLPTLKYSRTDDTPASNTGKSTQEEVEHYLEMQGDLEGTSEQDDALQTAEVETELDLFGVDEDETTEDDGEEELESEEYPWESINPILRLRGPVASGYGRGGKKLGVPTANVSAKPVPRLTTNFLSKNLA